VSAVKKSVSLPATLLAQAEERLKNLGYSSLSAYLQHLVRDDVNTRPAHVLRETPVPSKTTPSDQKDTVRKGRELVRKRADQLRAQPPKDD